MRFGNDREENRKGMKGKEFMDVSYLLLELHNFSSCLLSLTVLVFYVIKTYVLIILDVHHPGLSRGQLLNGIPVLGL